jgi:hypothetical protein
MYVERTLAGKLDVYQSYERGQILLEIAKMRGLNELDLRKMLSEGKVSAILFNLNYLNIRINSNN